MKHLEEITLLCCEDKDGQDVVVYFLCADIVQLFFCEAVYYSSIRGAGVCSRNFEEANTRPDTCNCRNNVLRHFLLFLFIYYFYLFLPNIIRSKWPQYKK